MDNEEIDNVIPLFGERSTPEDDEATAWLVAQWEVFFNVQAVSLTDDRAPDQLRGAAALMSFFVRSAFETGKIDQEQRDLFDWFVYTARLAADKYGRD
jgi:hypothetical protein